MCQPGTWNQATHPLACAASNVTTQVRRPRSMGYEEELPSDCRPLEILAKYLEQNIPFYDTTERLATPIEAFYHCDDQDTAYVCLHHTWHTFVHTIEQTTHDSPNHVKLADLLTSLRHRNSPSVEKARSFDYANDLWHDLPYFEPTTTPPWSPPSEHIRSTVARLVDQEADTLGQLGGPDAFRLNYMNANAFLARLVHVPGAPDFETYALLAMHWALEEDVTEEDATVNLSLNVPGAVMWILYAGQWLWRCEWKEFSSSGRGSSQDALYSVRGSAMWKEGKKKGFCEERWRLWRDGFEKVARMEGLCEDTRELAREAEGKMRWIEENVGKGLIEE